MGICNFYRRFCIKYNDFVDPFRDLLRKNAEWNWNEGHTQAFLDLKNNFIRVVCLKHILAHKTFKIQCDASEKGIAGVLFQLDDQGHHRTVALISR